MDAQSADLMTVEDVASYLRVAERTIYDWAQKGDIPCGKLGASWRFRRADIDQWLAEKFDRKPPVAKADAGEVSLAGLLSPEQLLFVPEKVDKKEVLTRLCETLAKSDNVSNGQELKEGIFRREELMSTGIGLGVAVPHVRLESVSDVAVAAGVCKFPIEDYDSLDGQPVQIIFMIAAAAGQHAKHIRLLSQIANFFKDENNRRRILEASSAQEALLALTGGE